MEKIYLNNEDASFVLEQPENYSDLYFPIAGIERIKSAITPNLGGDCKLNQETFVLEPVSIENLHNNRSNRNFWCDVDGVGIWSATGNSAEAEMIKFTDRQDKSQLQAGFMWHTVSRKSLKYRLSAKITSFVPLEYDVECMYVELENISNETCMLTPTAAIPIYGRSADNIRDHRHVTSLLHRITTTENGVLVKPTMSFDERGYRKNDMTYFAVGISADSENPTTFYPTVEQFLGEGGIYTHPRALLEHTKGVGAGEYIEGKEAFGGISFEKKVLQAGEKAQYIIMLGATDKPENIPEMIHKYDSAHKVEEALQQVRLYWQEKVNVKYHTKDAEFDNFMRWVSFQPILRRIYGCSFLPHHDYGRGGRGWRDLWQDCLSLLIMDPGGVRQMILDNYGGVRIDGTNATIIGDKQGEFIADRNNITRVWMDHGVWPFMTTKLYMEQTGDSEILLEQIPYFKDMQCKRGNDVDRRWNDKYGMCQKMGNGEIYYGTVLEHLLVQHLCAFYEVGEHNHILLRDADWNDALDMANKHGESVAFTCAYAGNLRQLAKCLQTLHEKKGVESVELLEETRILLNDRTEINHDIEEKKKLLENYLMLCRHNISGKKVQIPIVDIIEILYRKSEWMMEHIRQTEWISGENDEGWFNSYYDEQKKKVEGFFDNGVRMMLTGQVFAIMSHTAKAEQVKSICKSADHYLYVKEIGGYRLNTNFHEEKLDLGRMFGFAYGEKENGAVFSHMTVMYANALYHRGFVKEGYKALQTLADTALNFEISKIYPGIPEYFNAKGKGMYHYLTGAASWYMLTMITEVFGVHGSDGDLCISPKLVKQQFDEDGKASVKLMFAGKQLEVIYENAKRLDYGEYCIRNAVCDGRIELVCKENCGLMERQKLIGLHGLTHRIYIKLDEKQNYQEVR